MDGKFADMKDSTLRELQELSKYERMVEIAKEIENEFNIFIPIEEIGYLFGIKNSL